MIGQPGQNLRRREVPLHTDDGDDGDANETPVSKAIKSLDIHPKLKRSARESGSASGAFAGIFLIVVVAFVVWEESNQYFKPVTEDMMFVDIDRSEKMNIFVNVSFHNIKCGELMIDAVDKNGDQQIAVAHDVTKTSLRRAGDAIAWKKQIELGKEDGITFLPADYCGSCFGAAPSPDMCCNTCEELKTMYEHYGRSPSLAESSPQCMRGKNVRAMPGEEGCRIEAHLNVNKMKGNFHVAAGFSHRQAHGDHSHHIHHVNITQLEHYNMSHTIHHISFGPHLPNMVYPLDGASFITDDVGQLKYFIQLVPSVYIPLSGESVQTNQYAVSSHFAVSEIHSNHFKLPGVYWEYDYFSMRIKYQEQRKSLTQFFIRVCAVCGGMYVVLELLFRAVDTLLWRIKGGGRRDGDLF